MKIGFSIKSQVLIGFGLISLIGSTGCVNNQKAASATLPASPAGYPGSQQVVDDNPIPSLASTEESKVRKVERKPAPFVLREGETLVDHKVASGDNLTKLARKYGSSVRRIQSANGLSGDMILTGKVYKIPTTGDITPSSPPASTFAASPPKPTPPPVSAPAPPSAPSTFLSPSLNKTYPRTARPSFAPREIKYSNSTLSPSPGQTTAPAISSPTQSAFSVPIRPPDTSGSGAAFPSHTFGADSPF